MPPKSCCSAISLASPTIHGSTSGGTCRPESRSRADWNSEQRGLHQPFKILTAKPNIFGKPTFAYLDAGESATRRYTAFLTKVPNDFAGVNSVVHRDGTII